MKICVSIGHSFKEQGATTRDGKTSEYIFNTALAQLIKDQLVKDGYEVVITNRLTDGGGTGMTADVRAINASASDLCVELHCNAFNTKAQGCETLYWYRSKKAKQLAQCIQNEMVNALGNNDRGEKGINSSGRGAKVLRETEMPMVITEPFFIDNPEEFNNAFNKIDKLAKGIATGIKQYIGKSST